MSDDLKSKAAKGLKWSTIDNVFQQVFQVAFNIIMARMLDLEDFGIIATLNIFIAVAAVFQDSGFGMGLIRKKEITREECNAVFYFSVLTSLLLYLVLFFSSGLIADFYQKPILNELSKVLSLTFFISSFGIVPHVILTRKVDYRSFAFADIAALVLSVTFGIVLAVIHYGVWALCLQTVSYHLIRTTLLWHFSRWKPFSSISFSPLKGMFSFSSKILITNFINSIVSNFASSLISKMYNFNQSALYSQANRWYSKLSFIVLPIQTISVPIISNLNDDMERQKRVFRKIIKSIAFTIFPITIFFAFISHEFILITITEKWLPCVPYLQLLCVSTLFAPIESLFFSLITCRGKSGALSIFVFTKSAFIFAGILGFVGYGIIPMIIVLGIINYIYILIEAYYVFKLIRYKFTEFAYDTMPYLLISIVLVAGAYFVFLPMKNIWAALIFKFSVPALVYLGIMWACRSEIFMEGKEYVMKYLNRMTGKAK